MSDESVEKFMTEPSTAAKELAALRVKNEQTVQRIAALGLGIDPTTLARERAGVMEAYIYEEIFTEAQRENFNLRWQRELHRQLTELEGRARTHVLTDGVRPPGPAGRAVSNKLWRPGS